MPPVILSAPVIPSAARNPALPLRVNYARRLVLPLGLRAKARVRATSNAQGEIPRCARNDSEGLRMTARDPFHMIYPGNHDLLTWAQGLKWAAARVCYTTDESTRIRLPCKGCQASAANRRATEEAKLSPPLTRYLLLRGGALGYLDQVVGPNPLGESRPDVLRGEGYVTARGLDGLVQRQPH